MKTLAERILAKASRPGGASAAQLTTSLFDAVHRPQARQRMHELLVSKHLLMFSRPAVKKGRPAEQYFTDPEAGAKWAACKQPELRPHSRQKAERKKSPAQPKASKQMNFATLVDPSNRKKGAHWASLPSKSAPQVVVVPAGLKAKVLPGALGYDPRFQVDPSTRVVGGFASMGPGRYLDGSV